MYKQYYDDNGALVSVSCGISRGDKWMSVRQKTPRAGTHRITSPQLPVRATRDEAQNDLDAYAIARKWDEAD